MGVGGRERDPTPNPRNQLAVSDIFFSYRVVCHGLAVPLDQIWERSRANARAQAEIPLSLQALSAVAWKLRLVSRFLPHLSRGQSLLEKQHMKAA